MDAYQNNTKWPASNPLISAPNWPLHFPAIRDTRISPYYGRTPILPWQGARHNRVSSEWLRKHPRVLPSVAIPSEVILFVSASDQRMLSLSRKQELYDILACLGFSDVGKRYILFELNMANILVTKGNAVQGCNLSVEFPGHLQVVQDALVSRNNIRTHNEISRLRSRAQNMRNLRSKRKFKCANDASSELIVFESVPEDTDDSNFYSVVDDETCLGMNPVSLQISTAGLADSSSPPIATRKEIRQDCLAFSLRSLVGVQ
jgi:hypothetical protein